MLSKFTALFLIAFLVVVPAVHSLECYLCSPESGFSCQDPTTSQCTGSCGKEMYRGMLKKGCYQINQIDTYHENGCFSGPNGEWFCTCNSHLCNSSSRTLLLSFGSLLALCSVVYLIQN